MSDAFYAGMAGTAKKLLRDKGQPMIMRRQVIASSDPITGQVVPAEAVSITVYGIVGSFSAQHIAAASGLIQLWDCQAIIESGHAPTKDDTLTIQGEPWGIIGVDTVGPGGTAIIYRLHLRAM